MFGRLGIIYTDSADQVSYLQLYQENIHKSALSIPYKTLIPVDRKTLVNKSPMVVFNVKRVYKADPY